MNKSFTAKRKLWKVMKICATQGMIAILICGMAIAHDDHAQLLDKKIVVSVRDVSLKVALKEIGAAGDVKISYRNDQYKKELNEQVSVESNGRSLGEVLDALLAPYHIRYKVNEDRQSIVFELRNGKVAGAARTYDPVPNLKAAATPATITGKVTDAGTQLPMAGVNIVIKGTARGTTTDAGGKYSLESNVDDVLVFSFVGYNPFEIRLGNQSVIDVALEEDAKNLNEVTVNAGYWKVNEKEQTGNIARITSKEIQNQNVSNPLQAMQGRMAGVYIQQNTGVPGGAFSIKIRGRNSLRSDGNDPLYIVDGVPFTPTSLNSASISSIVQGGNPLTSINPADIESIEVLKDADATAVYGSRGANGVVLITTKKGKSGKTKFDMNVYSGAGQVSSSMDLLTTPQYIKMRKEAFKNDGNWPIPPSLRSQAPDLLRYDTTRYTDWQKQLIGGTAPITSAQASISGGNASTQFLFGFGYYKEGTVFPGDYSYKRGSANLNVNHSSQDTRFKVSASFNYSSSANDLVSGDLTRQAVLLPPNSPSMYDDVGKINWTWANPFFQNPLIGLERKYNNITDNLVANATLGYEVIKGVTIKSSFGLTTMHVEEFSTNPLTTINPAFVAGQTGSTTFADGSLKTWIIEPQAEYIKTFGGGTLRVLAGGSFQESIQSGKTLSATGYSSDALLENIKAATALAIINSTYSQYRYEAIFGRLNYNWKERYIINLTGRRDGSSRFGPGNRFGNFGAAGLAWVFSNETAIKDALSFLSFGKIRTSYGITGSDAIGNYQYLDTYSSTTYPYNGSSGLVSTRLNNPDYSWESNKKFEVGLELGIFQDKVQLSTSWFRNRSSNQLVGLPLPVITGQASVQYNLPATVDNTGWEFQMTSTNISRGGFQWTTSFNLTIPENTLVDFPNLDAFPAYRNLYKVGESIFVKRVLKSTGVNPATGLYRFEDVNKDGSISTANDGQFIKDISQKLYGGINNGLAYNGFELNFFFQFVKQEGFNYLQAFGSPGSLSNQPTLVLNHWQQPGDLASIQRYSHTGAGSAAYISNKSSDQAISDASFIRLKNVSLSYSLPATWTRKAKISSIRVYIQGQNLLTFTPYAGFDPETQVSISLPPLRTVTAGIQVTL